MCVFAKSLRFFFIRFCQESGTSEFGILHVVKSRLHRNTVQHIQCTIQTKQRSLKRKFVVFNQTTDVILDRKCFAYETSSRLFIQQTEIEELLIYLMSKRFLSFFIDKICRNHFNYPNPTNFIYSHLIVFV